MATFKEIVAKIPFGYTLDISIGEHDLHEGIWNLRLSDWDGNQVKAQTTTVTLDNASDYTIGMMILGLAVKVEKLREASRGGTPAG